MKNKYNDEKNVQILISLLKQNNIRNIIVNPGTTNISFVASIQEDAFFKVFSCVDERSACYLACGMAEEINEPVVITCTGATASRNYVPGLTEAYYKKIPVIAITFTQPNGRIGHNIPQVIDRTMQFNDIVKKSVQLYSVNTAEDAWTCNVKVNEAMIECKNNGGGPVHINVETLYSNNFECEQLPDERKIENINYCDDFPKIEKDKIAIFIGNHKIINEKLTKNIDEFCEKYNAVVLCDHTSNYHGKYRVLANIVTDQCKINTLRNVDLLIDIGNVSGAYMGLNPKEVWRVNPDGKIRDTYKKLKYIFSLNEVDFFERYNKLKKEKNICSYYEEWIKEKNRLLDKLSSVELPFSNAWMTQQIVNKFEDDSIIHLGILNTLRAWNYFDSDKRLNCYCNTGGFGIDGIMSTALGASLVTNKNVYCFIGDLAFFYDMNSIGNRELKNNLRVMLINNGGGTEFHNYNHRAVKVTGENNLSLKFIAADGHFGNKSSNLVQHYAEDLGFEYLTAKNKAEFLKQSDKFINGKFNKPVLFEVFTNFEDESEAIKKIQNLDFSSKTVVKNMIGAKGVKLAKKILKK